MKKIKIAIVLLGCLSLGSCATLTGGVLTECQKTSPRNGQPHRLIPPAPFVVGIFFPPSLAIDFITGAIYKPCVPSVRVKSFRDCIL